MAGVFGNRKWFSTKSVGGLKKAPAFRAAIRADVKEHKVFDGKSIEYRTRDLENLREFKVFDLRRRVSSLLRANKGKRLKVLDLGAGYLFLSADLKKVFKRRINLTALSLSSSIVTEETEAKLKKRLAFLAAKGKTKEDPQLGILRHRLELIRATKRNSRRVDSFGVSLFENYSPEEKYGLIIDIHGPSTHSAFPVRVIEQYANLLETNGVVYTTGNFGGVVNEKFGKSSDYAKQTGTYLTFASEPSTIAGVRTVALGVYKIVKHKL